MKKIFLILILSLSVFLLFSCTQIPVMKSLVPADPSGTSEPTTWGNDVSMYLSIDKRPPLLPLSVPDYVRLKVSIPDVSTDLTADNFTLFEDGKAQGFSLDKESSISKNLDIVFVMDTTGSMSSAITGVKNSVTSFIATLTSAGYNAKVAVVPYDDDAPAAEINIDGETKQWHDLTDGASASAFIDKLYANGGGDSLENAYAGIMYAWNNCSWRPGSQRVIILITDEGSHYKSESYPGGAAGNALYDKSEVIEAIQGYATLHGVFVPGYYYNSSVTDYSDPTDPREIVAATGGLIEYTDSSGNVDLNTLGITNYVQSSWIITFESDSSAATHTISLYFKDGDKEGKIEKEIAY